MTDLATELAALAEKATPGPLAVSEDPIDGRDYQVLAVSPSPSGMRDTWVMRAEHNWNEAMVGERRISWKEAESNAALYALIVNNLPTILQWKADLDAAEARIAKLEEALRAFISWGNQRCPCENEEPNPCLLCGASIENLEACKAADETFPRSILANARTALENRNG